MPAQSKKNPKVTVPIIAWTDSLAQQVVIAPYPLPLGFRKAHAIMAMSRDNISCGQHAIIRSEGVRTPGIMMGLG